MKHVHSFFFFSYDVALKEIISQRWSSTAQDEYTMNCSRRTLETTSAQPSSLFFANPAVRMHKRWRDWKDGLFCPQKEAEG